MPPSLPSKALKRASIPSCTANCTRQQQRNASLLRRPHRPYTFTQLVTLSDGSTYLTRTTSPSPIYKSTKDTRNHPLWQPSLDSLRNVENDEAGRLRAFRQKFGRGWDAEDSSTLQDGQESGGQGGGDLMDLISGSAARTPKEIRDAIEVAGQGKGKQEIPRGEGEAPGEFMKQVSVKKGGVITKVWVEDKGARNAAAQLTKKK